MIYQKHGAVYKDQIIIRKIPISFVLPKIYTDKIDWIKDTFESCWVAIELKTLKIESYFQNFI